MKEKFITDEELVLRFRAGSRESFWTLFNRYEKIATQLGHKVAPNIMSYIGKEDLNTLFHRSLNKAIDKFNFSSSKFMSYFSTILKYELTGFAKECCAEKEKSGPKVSLSFEPNPFEDYTLSDVIADTKQEKDFLTHIDTNQFMSFYKYAEHYCPPETREIIMLIYLGYSFTEIADLLKMKYSVVRRSVMMLKEIIERMEESTDFYSKVCRKSKTIQSYNIQKSKKCVKRS